MKKSMKILMSALCIAVLCASAVLLGGCGKTAKTDIIVSGSTSVEAIMTPLAGEYEKNNNVRIKITPNSSGAGITDIIEDRSEIGMSSRTLTDKEKESIDDRNLCLDGIVLVVSKNCAVNEVTNEEIYNLFMHGTAITHGGSTIRAAVGREGGSGTRDGFDEKIKDASGVSIKESKTAYNDDAIEATSTGAVITAVTGDKENKTVGYVSMGSYLQNTDKLKALEFKAYGQDDYVEASKETILNDTYKLQRPFVILTKKGRSLSDAAKAFYDWLFGEDAAKIIEEKGYVLEK